LGSGLLKPIRTVRKHRYPFRVLVLLCRYCLTAWSGIRGYKIGSPKAAESLRMILTIPDRQYPWRFLFAVRQITKKGRMKNEIRKINNIGILICVGYMQRPRDKAVPAGLAGVMENCERDIAKFPPIV
jgi:hypothetical protein